MLKCVLHFPPQHDNPLNVVPHEPAFVDLDRVYDAFREFYVRSHRLVDRKMTEQGASLAKARILSMIARDGPIRSIDLASAFGYAPRSVTEAIDGLERDLLVRRDPDPEDRRAKRISLTDEGRAAVESSEASRRAFIEAVYGTLDRNECEEVVRLIGKLVERLGHLGG